MFFGLDLVRKRVSLILQAHPFFMLTLYLCRHAQAKNNGSGTDHNRDLTAQGVHDCRQIARLWKDKEKSLPQHWVSSSAIRAINTARLMSAETDADRPIQVIPELYHAGLSDLLHIIQAFPDQQHSAVLFGHNPTISDALHRLCGSSYFSVLPGTLAKITFELDSWSMVSHQTGYQEWVLSPR